MPVQNFEPAWGQVCPWQLTADGNPMRMLSSALKGFCDRSLQQKSIFLVATASSTNAQLRIYFFLGYGSEILYGIW